LKPLDSGSPDQVEDRFHRNDDSRAFSTFYETINIWLDFCFSNVYKYDIDNTVYHHKEFIMKNWRGLLLLVVLLVVMVFGSSLFLNTSAWAAEKKIQLTVPACSS
jgi:hypothetical protein